VSGATTLNQPALLAPRHDFQVQHIASPHQPPAELPPRRRRQMSTKPKSRWDEDTETTAAELARLKAEKAARKALKSQQKQKQLQSTSAAAAGSSSVAPGSPPASKRRKLDRSDEPYAGDEDEGKLKLLRFNAPTITPCAHVDWYEKLNHIEEGSYGVVSRARDSRTGEIVALKKLKLERETDGFPITSLREIQTLMAARHENVVNLREVVVGGTLKEYFFYFLFYILFRFMGFG